MARCYLTIILILLLHWPAFTQQTVGLFQNQEQAFNGYTLFSNNEWTYLIDNCGFLVNNWESEYDPGLSAYLVNDGQLLRTARIPGNFFGGGQGGRVELFSWEGDLLWATDFANDSIHTHHDIEPLPNGHFLVLAWSRKSSAEVAAAGRMPVQEIWSEKIMEIKMLDNNEVSVVWEWDIWDHLIQDQDPLLSHFGNPEDHPGRLNVNYLGAPSSQPKDWIHLNAISYHEELDQIAISSKHLGEIWIIDHSTTTAEAASDLGGRYGKGGDLLYRFGNPQAYNRGTASDQLFRGQHDIQWLPDFGTGELKMMVFNNTNGFESSSIEIWSPPIDDQGFYQLDGASAYGPAEVDREFTGTGFYSSIMSGVQMQPNGNLLICVADDGYFFEVTAEDEVVWEYINPVNSNSGPVEQGGFIRFNQTFRAERYEPDNPVFTGRELIPGSPIELNPFSSDCIIYDSLVSTVPLLEETGIEILGNPFSNHLSIHIDKTAQEWQLDIFDLLGRPIQREVLRGGMNSIQTPALSQGIYLLRFQDQDGQVFTQKVLKSN